MKTLQIFILTTILALLQGYVSAQNPTDSTSIDSSHVQKSNTGGIYAELGVRSARQYSIAPDEKGKFSKQAEVLFLSFHLDKAGLHVLDTIFSGAEKKDLFVTETTYEGDCKVENRFTNTEADSVSITHKKYVSEPDCKKLYTLSIGLKDEVTDSTYYFHDENEHLIREVTIHLDEERQNDTINYWYNEKGQIRRMQEIASWGSVDTEYEYNNQGWTSRSVETSQYSFMDTAGITIREIRFGKLGLPESVDIQNGEGKHIYQIRTEYFDAEGKRLKN